MRKPDTVFVTIIAIFSLLFFTNIAFSAYFNTKSGSTRDEILAMIEQCEATLPRDQKCRVVAVAPGDASYGP